MKEGILLKSFNSRFQYSQDQSQITQYNDNPHIYSNLWHYIFNLIGVAVGFGAFWRFPYLIYKNGGGVFIIPYTIAMILIGIPILYLEIGIGQMHRVSLPFIFKKLHPSLKIVGLAIMTATFHMSSVYNILLTYCYRFLFASFLPTLPFADQPITSSKYFHEVILEQSDSIQHFGGINMTLFLIYIVSLILCHLIVKDGAKTTGKIAVYTAIGPFLIFFILVAYGFSLDGAIDGLKYIFEPDWSKLWNSQVWVDATTQVFYQLSIGLGVVSNLSSMKPRREDFLKSIVIVPLSLFLCGILSAATIFMYLSHFSYKSGISIEHLQLSGPQLSFNVLPKALCLLPFPNLWLIIFFLAMILLGISSQFGVIQAIYTCLIDEYKQRRLNFCGFSVDLQTAKYLTLFVISFGSILLTSSAGIYYLQFFDYYMSNIPYTLWVLVQLYFFVHMFKLQQLISTITSYTKVQTPKIIQYCLRSYWLPGLLITNLVFAIINQTMKFKTYSLFMYLMGWIFSLYPVFLIYYYLRKQWQGWQQVKLTFRDINRRITFL